MKIGIVASSESGIRSTDEKLRIIGKLEKILNEKHNVLRSNKNWGLDIGKDSKGFCDYIHDISNKVDIVIAAGGDGTLSDAINSVNLDYNLIAYFPLGSFNATRYSLDYPTNLKSENSFIKIAEKIRDGSEHRIDIINCNNRYKALFASVGFDAYVLSCAAEMKHNKNPLDAAVLSIIKEGLRYNGCEATINADDKIYNLPNLFSAMIMKQPYYGLKMKIATHAKPNDGYMDLIFLNKDAIWLKLIFGIFTALLGANMVGTYIKCKKISIKTEEKTQLQIEGSPKEEGNNFTFEILPKKLRLWY